MLVGVGLVYYMPARFLKWRFVVMVRYEEVGLAPRQPQLTLNLCYNAYDTHPHFEP